jgi:hypothetical protein
VIHEVPLVGPWRVVHLRHQDLLRDDRPPRARSPNRVQQPTLLPGPEHRRGRVECAAAQWPGTARLVAAVLPRIHHEERRQAAELKLAVQLQGAAVRACRRPKRHVLVVGLICRRAALQEHVHRHRFLGDDAGVVVVHLVIVPADGEWLRGVRPLQIGVRLVLREPGAVLVQRPRLRSSVAAHLAVAPSRLVNVVAQVEHQREVLLGKVTERSEVSRLEVVARHERESHAPGDGIDRRQRARTADWALFASGVELVPVRPIGPQPRRFDVDGMGMRR